MARTRPSTTRESGQDSCGRARAEALAIQAHLMRYKGQLIDKIAERFNIFRCIAFRHLTMPFDPEPEWGDTKHIGGELRDGRGAEGGIRIQLLTAYNLVSIPTMLTTLTGRK